MSENEEFIREFLEECDENLDQLDKDLVALEQSPRDTKRLESIFRAIHTIKGTSGFFGFSKLGALAHDGEGLLGRLRDGELILNQEIASTLLQLIDGIRDMLGSIRDSGSEGSADYRELSANLIRLALSPGCKPTAEEAAAAGAEREGKASPRESPEVVEDREAPAQESRMAGEVVSQQPESSPLDEVAAVTQSAPQMDPTTLAAKPPAAEESPTEKVRPDTAVGPGSIRVDVRSLDDLLDLAGELVLARNQLNQFSASVEDTALLKTIQRLSLITSELQEGVMQTRLQPMATIWRKFPRVIRDLAVACGKDIELEQEGEDTELDRSLLEAIKDPLTHLIRNSVDHGIELPEVRKARGKAVKGRVLLRAYHEGGQVSIEITDDGGGIDVEKVKQRASERGMIDAEQAGTISDHDLVQMIFRPGFSTAEKVTDVSGRGVGMDVVKTNIERIGGTIILQNRPGLGTTVRITIPLTLAIIPALIVTSGNDRFAVPQVNLIELINYGEEATCEPVEWVHDAPVCRLRGRLLPLVYLNHALEIEEDLTARGNATNIVVLQVEGGRFGLVVDQVINTEEIVVKSLSRGLKSIPMFAGATIMGDGGVVLILDVVGLARRAGLTITKTELVRAHDEVGEAQVEPLPFLLCESNDLRRVAIRLTEVQRLEEFSPDKVERAASTEAVQYGGKIMPLVRLSRLLGWSDEKAGNSENLMVVVHRHLGRNAGLVVPRIVDIVGGPHEIEHGSDESGLVMGSSLIEGRVTDVIDLAAAFRVAGIRFVEPVGDSTS